MELEEAKKYLEHEIKVYEDNIEINQLIGGKAGEIQHEVYKTVLQALDNSISKEKVKDKIEIYKRLEMESFDRDSIQADEYRAIIKVLQELLEE